MELKKFKHDDWIQIWEGDWSFLSCSHFSDQYTKEIRFGPRPFVSQCILFFHDGRSTAWIRQHDRDILGKYLSAKVVKNPTRGKTISTNLKNQVDNVLPYIEKYKNGKMTNKQYQECWHKILTYYHPHINVKYIVDYLKPKLLQSLLTDFEDARIYAEPVFELSETLVSNFAKQIGRKTHYSQRQILSLTKKELYGYFEGKKLPQKNTLEKRYHNSAILADQKNSEVVTGRKLKEIEKIIFNDQHETMLKGVSAFPGKVTAVARVINDPNKGYLLKQGDILVSGMTRPEFLPIMKRASAFVTDSGGVLSHAAVVAREMKKPCITGTKIATKIFRSGDVLEVDATKGVVKKIK